MNIKQFAVLIAGITLAILIIRYQPIRNGNPFYSPVQKNIAQYLGKEGYRPPAVSRELNGVAAGIVLFGMAACMAILRDTVKPLCRQAIAPLTGDS